MNKSISINKELWHAENQYGDVEIDMGTTETASGVTRKTRKSSRGRLLVLQTNDQIEIANLVLQHRRFCPAAEQEQAYMSVLQKDEKVFFSG